MQIDTGTVYLGLFGNPVKHSLSPLMHNLTLQKMALNCVYLPFEISRNGIQDAVAAIRSLNFRGVNVTIPFKEEVIKYIDDLSEEAAACGAVNLISNEKGRLVGFNTDGKGFLLSLQEEGVVIKGRALFIGAGGAARSLAYEMAKAGIGHLDFMDIDHRRAADLAEFITRVTSCSTDAFAMEEEKFVALSARADIILNCSPVGMYPHNDESPVLSLDFVKSQTVLCDIIYNPLKTKFLLMGEERGLKTINGLPMFVNQGALTLEILLGISPPLDYMKEVVRNQLE